MNQKESFRHELKYEISYGEYAALRQRLLAVMKKDAHTGADGYYQIRSLYFDNCDDRAYREKQDGLAIRHKFRIRYYNGDTSYIVLEKKSKIGNLCQKQACRITKEETERILQGDAEWMRKESKRPLLMEFYGWYQGGMLRPKTIVVYTREPFVYPAGNVRVTFDSAIRSGLYHTNFLDETWPLMDTSLKNTSLKNRMILEVKYDAYLPEAIQLVLQNGSARLQAFSKYAACRQYE